MVYVYIYIYTSRVIFCFALRRAGRGICFSRSKDCIAYPVLSLDECAAEEEDEADVGRSAIIIKRLNIKIISKPVCAEYCRHTRIRSFERFLIFISLDDGGGGGKTRQNVYAVY